MSPAAFVAVITPAVICYEPPLINLDPAVSSQSYTSV